MTPPTAVAAAGSTATRSETEVGTYTIVFSRQSTLSTALSAGITGQQFYLKARAANGKSHQHIGYATIVAPGRIEVSTVAGTPVGTVGTRKAARALIDAHHRAHNAEGYWLWVRHTLTGAS